MANVKYRYTLPGDENRLLALAYSHGLNTIPAVFFEQLPPGAPLPDGFIRQEIPLEHIEEMCRQVCDVLIKGHDQADEQPTTNAPALFRKHYTRGFTEGYQFSLYASTQGLISIMYDLPKERRSDLCFSFAWEKFLKECPYTGEPENEEENLILLAIDELKNIHKQYRRLN